MKSFQGRIYKKREVKFMKFKDYLTTYMLTRNLNDYRERQRKEVVNDENEFDENYFRVDDKPKDGRGNF
jgi:hypothetical protein